MSTQTRTNEYVNGTSVKEIVVNQLVRTRNKKNENTNDKGGMQTVIESTKKMDNVLGWEDERGGNEKEKGFGFTKTMKRERVLVSRHRTNSMEEFSLKVFFIKTLRQKLKINFSKLFIVYFFKIC